MSLTEKYVALEMADNGVVELRHQESPERWISGLYDNAEDLLAEARRRCQVGNLFTTLNRPAPLLADNRMGTHALGNDDFQWITRLPFDFDPIRPSGIPATDTELSAALQVAQHTCEMFLGMQWPAPMRALSGNGVHLIFRTHLPNTPDVRDMLAAIYTGLDQDVSTDSVKFDRTVRNAGRIFPLYGSKKRKGVPTHERPHRFSRILEWPPRLQQITITAIEALANYYARRAPHQASEKSTHETHQRIDGDGDYRTLDIVAWFAAHGLLRRPLSTYQGIPRYAARCPWEDEHSSPSHDMDTSTVIFEAGEGWPGFSCSHAHCEGRSIRDVLQVLGDADVFCSRSWKGKDRV